MDSPDAYSDMQLSKRASLTHTHEHTDTHTVWSTKHPGVQEWQSINDWPAGGRAEVSLATLWLRRLNETSKPGDRGLQLHLQYMCILV